MKFERMRASTGTSRIVFFAGKIIYKRAFFARSYFSEELFWANFPEPDTDRLEYWMDSPPARGLWIAISPPLYLPPRNF